MATTSPPAELLRDLRSAGEPMRSFTLKLPSQLIDSLDRYAAAHSAHRSTVARNVLAQGLEALEGN